MFVGVALEDDRLEQVEISEREVLQFPRGIVGFEPLARYALLRLEPPLRLLQSVDDPHVGFVLLDPLLIDPTYRIELSEEDRCLLRLDAGEQAEPLCIATLSAEGLPCTANLRAPVVLNRRKQLGTQAILQESCYPMRQPIGAMSGEAAGAGVDVVDRADRASVVDALGAGGRQC